MYKIVVTTLGHFSNNVRVTYFEKNGPTKKPYTKFRFKFMANFVCWCFNKRDNLFNSYKVVKINEINLTDNQ
jgi:hypothetical protein